MKHKHGGDIYRNNIKLDYSANINPLGIPPSAKKAAQEAISRCIHYPDVEYELLLSAIEEAENIPKEYIICGNGASELIFMVCLARKPRKALLLAPTFAEYEQALRSVDCEINYYTLEEEKGFILQEDFLTYLEDDIDMVFLCNPNNPTGQLIDQRLLLQIAQRCEKQNTLLVLDECFIDFIQSPEEFSMKEYVSQFNTLFLLKAFTKIYGMPGLRLGYGFTRNKGILSKMKEVCQPWSISVPAEAAGIAALKEKVYLAKTHRLMKIERKYLLTELKQGLVVKTYGASANFIFFQASEELGEMLRKKGILIRDCSNYLGLKKGYYRIAIRGHNENEKLIQIWKEALKGKACTVSVKKELDNEVTSSEDKRWLNQS